MESYFERLEMWKETRMPDVDICRENIAPSNRNALTPNRFTLIERVSR